MRQDREHLTVTASTEQQIPGREAGYPGRHWRGPEAGLGHGVIDPIGPPSRKARWPGEPVIYASVLRMR